MKCTLKGLCVNPMWLPPTEEGMIEEDTHLETFLYLIVHYYGTEHLYQGDQLNIVCVQPYYIV